LEWDRASYQTLFIQPKPVQRQSASSLSCPPVFYALLRDLQAFLKRNFAHAARD
jgi:hypothetical protein